MWTSMTPRLPRLSFHSRILLAFVGLIILALLGSSTVMYIAARRTGLGLAEQQLWVAERVVEKALQSRNLQMRAQTVTLASDAAFREAIISRHKPTIAAALENQRARIPADVFALIDDDGSVSASADGRLEFFRSASLQEALHQARLRNTAPMVVNFRGRLLQLVIVPVKAPDLVGWACVGSFIDDDFLRQAKDTAGADISLLAEDADESRLIVVASTLAAPQRTSLERAGALLTAHDPSAFQLALEGESALTVLAAGNNELGTIYSVVAQMPMSVVAAPVIALRGDMLIFGGLVTVVGLIAAIVGARLLTEPVRALANAARSLSMSKRRGTDAAGDDELAHVARAFHALARSAHYDGLTGLPNRALLNERLKASIERMRGAKDSLAVVFIDLDGFKQINDTLGHEMGDLVLRKTAQRLARVIAIPNTVARLGGDEFVLVLEKTDQAEAIRTVENLARIVGKSMASPSGPINVGMSAGIAMYPTLSLSQEQLLQSADAAMYLSKTRKAGPVVAALTAAAKPTPAPVVPAPQATDNPNDVEAEDTVSTDAWRGRDLITQNTKAVSAIRAPMAAEIPSNERERLSALRQLKYLDKPSRAAFDRITRLAVRSLSAPIALVSLVDENRQWFLSRIGLDTVETPRDLSFCAHAVFERKPLVVPDATRDNRFAGNPLVTDEPKIRAYAGAPVYTSDGHALGTLCVIYKRPHEFGEGELKALQDLAHIVDDMIRVREFTLAYERRRRQAKASKVSNGEFPLID
jgi:diguanylate cyclase (GGDEF)-like protein